MAQETTYRSAAAAHRTKTAGWRDGALLAARLLLGSIFVQSGFGKLTNLGGFAAGLEGMGVPLPYVAGTVGALIEFFAGVALVLGAWTWLAALLLILFTAAATAIAHRFWEYPPEQQMIQSIMFMKNLAIIGGFLAVLAAGPGRYGVDGWRGRA